MQVSPLPRNVSITFIAANYVELSWNDFSNNRYLYEIENSRDGVNWNSRSVFTGKSAYIKGLQEETEYYVRIRTRVPLPSFTASEWLVLPAFTTFKENSFTLQSQSNVEATKSFYQQKLQRNIDVVNFNSNVVSCALMRDGFQFDANKTNIMDIDDDIIKAEKSQMVLGKIPFVILNKSDVVVGSFEDTLYVFRKGTREGFFSTNNGISWTRYYPLAVNTVGGTNDGFSFKAANARAALVTNQSIVLGATASNNLRWSSITVKWSSVEARFNEVDDEFDIDGGGGAVIRFAGEIAFPTGINEIQCFDIDQSKMIVIAGGGALYTVDFSNPALDIENNITFNPGYEQIVPGVDNLYVKSCWFFNSDLYILVAGEYNGTDIVRSVHSGVWKFDVELNTFEKVLGDDADIDPVSSSLSTDGTRLIVSLDAEAQQTADLTNIKPYRKVFYSLNGDVWTFKPERFALESFYGFYRNDNMRVMIDGRANITVIVPEKEFIRTLPRTSSQFTQFGEYQFYIQSRIIFEMFPGFAKGVAFFNRETGFLIGYYEFQYRVRNRAEAILDNNLLFNAQLESISRNIVIDTSTGLPVREQKQSSTLTHLLDKIAPEHYIDGDNKMFGKFIDYYLESVSQKDMPYGQMRNMLMNRNVNTTSFLELFETDLAKRNITTQGDKRAELITFMHNRQNDFTSAKGVEASYKWMFRALYDIDVDVFIESQRSYETYMIIQSDEPDLDTLLAGVSIEGPSGRATVNYVERLYRNGQLYWQIVVQDPRGRFDVGDEIKNTQIDKFDPIVFEGTVVQSIQIRDANPDPTSIQTRSRSFYVIRVSSGLSMNRWKNDVVRFVHPVGFNFIGILLITMMMNTGLTLEHIETRSGILQSYKWDSGIPLYVWNETADLDGNGNYQYDSLDGTGFPKVLPNPSGGQPINPLAEYFTSNPEVFMGMTTQERRKNSSPLFDSTVHRFVDTRKV